MKKQYIFISFVIAFFLFCYFFYFSNNSYKKIQKLQQRITDLEKQLSEQNIKHQSSISKPFSSDSFLKEKKDYLYQKGFLNSNEILVNIQVPSLDEVTPKKKIKINYSLIILGMAGLLILFLGYRFRGNLSFFRRLKSFSPRNVQITQVEKLPELTKKQDKI